MSAHTSKNLAILACVLSTILSSIAWITEQEAVLALTPLVVTGYSMLFGAVILLGMARWQGPIPRPAELMKFKREFFLLTVWRSLLGQLFLVYALLYTLSSKVMFLTKIEPYLIVLWFWLFKGEKLRGDQLFLLALHIGGAVLLSTGGDLNFQADQLGDLLVILGVASNSLSYGPAQELTHKFGSTVTSGVALLIGAIIMLPVAILFAPSPFRADPQTLHGWYYLIITVLLFYVLSTVFWYYSLKGLKAWLSSALRCIGPVVAAPIAWLVYNKPLTWLQAIGAIVVIVTSALMIREKKMKKAAGAVV